MPSICTRHRRHDPNALSISVAHSLGIWIPASDAARKTDVPAGTLTSRPSMFKVTSLAILIGWIGLGVPRSVSLIDNIAAYLIYLVAYRNMHLGRGLPRMPRINADKELEMQCRDGTLLR